MHVPASHLRLGRRVSAEERALVEAVLADETNGIGRRDVALIARRISNVLADRSFAGALAAKLQRRRTED